MPSKPGKPRAYKVDPRLAIPRDMGRPPHVPSAATRGMVRALVLLEQKQDAIAATMGIDRKTLRKHYAIDLERGFWEMGAVVVNTMYFKAIGATLANPRPDPEKADGNLLLKIAERRFGFTPKAQEFVHTGALAITKIERVIVDPTRADDDANDSDA